MNFAQILRNLFTGWLSVIVKTAIAIYMVPFLLSKLGQEGYGLIGLLIVIIGFSAVADLGLRKSLSRELTELVHRRDRTGAKELCSTALILYLVIACLLSSVVILKAHTIVGFFKVGEEQADAAVTLMCSFVPLSFIVSFIQPVFSAGLVAHNRFDWVNSCQAVFSILTSLGIFVVMGLFNYGLWGWSAMTLLGSLMTLVGFFYLNRKVEMGVLFDYRSFRFSRIKSLFRLGGYLYILELTRSLSERADPLIVSGFFGPAGVALYMPASRISQVLRPFVLMLSNQMHPIATSQFVDDDTRQLQQTLLIGTKFTVILGGFVCACLFMFAESFTSLWLGAVIGDDYQLVAMLIMGFSIIDFTGYCAGTQWPVLLGMARLKFIVCTQVISAIINIIVSIYLVGYTSIGIVGVLYSTMVIEIIRRPLMVWYTANVLDLKCLDYFLSSYLRSFLCSIVALLTAYWAQLFLGVDSYLCLIEVGLLCALVWLATVWFIGLSKSERKYMRLLGIRLKRRFVQVYVGKS